MPRKTLKNLTLNFLSGVMVILFTAIIIIILIIVIISARWALSSKTHTLSPRPDVTLTMTLRPAFMTYVFGLHSDHYRSLRVARGRKSVSKALFFDSGWWAGSQLYSTEDGSLILHEGQNGCFEVLTPSGDPVIYQTPCIARKDSNDLRQCQAASTKPITSYQFKEWIYLGVLSEGGAFNYQMKGECHIKDAL